MCQLKMIAEFSGGHLALCLPMSVLPRLMMHNKLMVQMLHIALTSHDHDTAATAHKRASIF